MRGTIEGMERDTVAIYEREAEEFRRRRPPTRLARAEAFSRRVPIGAVRADLGCGPGNYCSTLGEPVVAMDAANAMLRLVPDVAPAAWRVQSDLEHLPFRDQSLGAAWASMSYLHVRRDRLPLALARLHWALQPGAPVHLDLMEGEGEGPTPNDDFPGRFFALWTESQLTDVLTGAGFVIEDLDRERGSIYLSLTRVLTLPDTVGPGMRVLVCGLNPSVYAAESGIGFARPGNRFWSAAIAAGLVSRDRDPRHAITHHQLGLTDLCKRATPRASDLMTEEYEAGLARVRRLVEWLQPRVVCFVGLDGWRKAVSSRSRVGVQDETFGGATAYLMPSTSGANASSSIAALTDHFREVARLAT